MNDQARLTGLAAALCAEVRQMAATLDALTRSASLPRAIDEDLEVIVAQTARAVASLSELESLCAAGPSAALSKRLHRMNNYFTGVASLATLCVSEVGDEPALSSNLQRVGEHARAAAHIGREIARGYDVDDA